MPPNTNNNPFLNQPALGGAPAQTPVPQAPIGVAPLQATPIAAPVDQQVNNLGSGAAQQTRQTARNPNSTQSTLQLSEVRDNMVIMIDGSMRAVVACRSINFDLMSDRERESVEYSYQNFLNSLNFPVQILVRSQRVDIGPYLDKLVTTRRTQDNMLLGVLMDDYINYIDVLSQEANIMEKSFYIVIPFFPNGDAANLIEQGKGFFGKLFAKPKNTITRIDTVAYEKAKSEIKNRVDNVIAGMFQIGVQSTQLDTKSLGELYYNFYNPDTAVRQPLGDFENSTGIYTKKATPPAAEGVQ
jgi:hypothetical protein